MENRLKKLLNEQDRLNRQIDIANRTANFAERVADRRSHDKSMKSDWLEQMHDKKMRQRSLNGVRKHDNENVIKS